jgi:hypothetical protein
MNLVNGKAMKISNQKVWKAKILQWILKVSDAVELQF